MRKIFLGPSDRLNTFDFKPVGQGLFYTGSLMGGRYNFVFDCGTLNDKSYIERQIDDYIYSLYDCVGFKPTIEFVVISHLHLDHYKGLYYLLQRCDVKQIILPYLGNDANLIRATLAFSIFGYSERLALMENDDDERVFLLHFMSALFNVDDNSDFSDFSDYREKVAFINKELEGADVNTWHENDRIYSMATRIIPGCKDHNYWHFSFIQSGATATKLSELSDKLEATFGKLNNAALIQLLRNSSNHVEEMRKIYEAVFGKGNLLNLTSIVLVHFPLYMKRRCILRKDYYINQYIKHLNLRIRPSVATASHNAIVSLLTGDAMIDQVVAKKIFSIIKNRKILILQVPHHGSKDNWNAIVINNITATNNVIPFGYGNNSNLPSAATVDYMINHSIMYVMVTQDCAFRYSIE